MIELTRRACLRAAVAALAAPLALAAAETEPLHVVLISGSTEYHSDESLTELADAWEKAYRARCTKVFGKDGAGDPLPGIVEALATADVVLVFTRRLQPPKDQLAAFQKKLLRNRRVG